MSDMTVEKAQALLDGATPGPWQVDACDPSDVVVWAADSELIGNVGASRIQGVSVVFDMDERNARIIAAAPDIARAYIAQAAELTRLRAKVAAADKLAERAAELEKQAKNAVRLGATTGAHWVKLGLAQMQTAAALSAYEGDKG